MCILRVCERGGWTGINSYSGTGFISWPRPDFAMVFRTTFVISSTKSLWCCHIIAVERLCHRCGLPRPICTLSAKSTVCHICTLDAKVVKLWGCSHHTLFFKVVPAERLLLWCKLSSRVPSTRICHEELRRDGFLCSPSERLSFFCSY